MSDFMKGKVALVTGASSGIGRATALAFARRGVNVVAANRSVEGGEETVRQIERAGGKAVFVRTDVSRAADCARMVDEAVATFGRLDYAFNNAGIEGALGATADLREDDFDKVIAVNLKGTWLSMKHEIPALLAQGGGSIVNCASVAGLAGVRGLPAYAASKHGVIGLTRTAALEYARLNVRVNAVCPGPIDTPMLTRIFSGNPEAERQTSENEPLGRIGRPDEVSGAVVWFCSPEASFTTGQALAVDGGWIAQ